MFSMLCLVLLIITGAYNQWLNAPTSQCHTLQCYTAEAEQ